MRSARSIPSQVALLLALIGTACSGGKAETSAGETTTGATETGGTSDGTETGTTGTTETGTIPTPETCESEGGDGCEFEFDNCKEDRDRDGVPLSCDNAPDHTNPDQVDIDGDGFGDIGDLCPTTPDMTNTADADRDGIGNGCDLCSLGSFKYNISDAVPIAMRVRSMPVQSDRDGDGIGDACDNCVAVPNCQGYGEGEGLTPYRVGMPRDEEAPDCQEDADQDMIGDACAGLVGPGAAGPVGYGNDDDFDQDGIVNVLDFCPRLPVDYRACSGDDECPSGATCLPAGLCNHADQDGDQVGDLCDTCLLVANPEQIVDGGNQEDDADGDFIGAACEQDAGCTDRMNPRAFAFYDVQANGRCCVTTYNGEPILDPDLSPVDPATLGQRPPGVLELPPGCDEALAASSDGKAHRLSACNVDDLADLWDYFCLLPTWDQDLDGVPDNCDLCPFAFDPGNQIYVDENDKEWPNSGKYCNGEYALGNYEIENNCMPVP